MHPILLYDGLCGLCNRLVQFTLRRDRDGVFRFASLQSALAADVLARRGVNVSGLDTVYVVTNHDPGKKDHSGGALLARTDAVMFVLRKLGGIWRAAAFGVRSMPSPVRDWIYRLVARHRYRIFGRYDSCPLPTEETRSRFLDL